MLVRDAARNDADLRISHLDKIKSGFIAPFFESFKFLFQLPVMDTAARRGGDESREIPTVNGRRFLDSFAEFYQSFAVANARRHPEQYGDLVLFAHFERCFHHLFGFLTVGWFKERDFGMQSIVAVVLLCLRGVQSGVVCRNNDASAFHAQIGARKERICSDVEPDVFHSRKRPQTCER